MLHARGLPTAQRNDPIGVALFAAAALHAALILGVGFDIGRDPPQQPEYSLDVTLVRPKPQAEQPLNPEFLAQTSQQGGAPRQADTTPAAPPSPPAVEARPTPAREVQRAGTPEPRVEQARPVVTTASAPRRERRSEPVPPVEAPSQPDIAHLLASTQQEIDRLTSQLDRRSNHASRTRRKAINASTQEFRYASYLEAWRKKVERIGNLNYPDEAKRRKLYGNLILHVAVRADGSVEKVRVVRSSGHTLLDDAAVRIVELAAPYAPFPADIRAEVDVLDITRTWQFLSGNRLFSGQ